jgi:hypothetical protein
MRLLQNIKPLPPRPQNRANRRAYRPGFKAFFSPLQCSTLICCSMYGKPFKSYGKYVKNLPTGRATAENKLWPFRGTKLVIRPRSTTPAFQSGPLVVAYLDRAVDVSTAYTFSILINLDKIGRLPWFFLWMDLTSGNTIGSAQDWLLTRHTRSVVMKPPNCQIRLIETGLIGGPSRRKLDGLS